MLTSRVLYAAAAAATLALTACGGGSDEEPIPSDKAGVVTVRDATVTALNGVYGDGTLNLTDVERKNPIGSTPELCSFKFDGAHKVGATGIEAFGDLRYESGGDGLYVLYLTFDGREYTSDELVNTAVRRDLDQVILNGKLLRASDGSGATVKVDAIIPMRGNRPAGC
ncbi:MAG: hypothetical protein ABS38_02885 [Acidovorax sp. SCN 68-22]|jgi:hypothetical protein|nr:MAG: hypothetical protein ABS38_02885 [Acidovorax sp. SCN 68-22]